MSKEAKKRLEALFTEASKITGNNEKLTGDLDRLIQKLDKIRDTIIESSIKGKLDNEQTPEGKKAWELLNLLLELEAEKSDIAKEVNETIKANHQDIKSISDLLKFLTKQATEDKYAKCINSQEVQAFNKAIESKPNIYTSSGTPAYRTKPGSVDLTAVFTKGELKQEGNKLYLFALMKYKKGSTNIVFTVDEYMSRRKLKSKPKAIKAIIRETKKLAGIQIELKSKSGDYGIFTPFPEFWYKNNQVRIELSASAQKIFDVSKAYEYIPTEILAIDSQTHPHSIPLTLKLSELKAMNHGKSRDDIHKVKELIRETEIPSYETVKERYQRQYKLRIIDPFERDLNACKDIYSWEYIQGTGNSWKEFKDAIVKIVWNNHPQDTIKTDENGSRNAKI